MDIKHRYDAITGQLVLWTMKRYPKYEIFSANTRTVFQRCREHNVTLNAKKLMMGFDIITFVGHDIDVKGINMSQKRIESTIAFCKLTSLKELQSFMTSLRTTCVTIPQWLNHYTTLSPQPQNKTCNRSHGHQTVTSRLKD